MQFYTGFYELDRDSINKPYANDLLKRIKRRNTFVAILSGITAIFLAIPFIGVLIVLPIFIVNLFVQVDGLEKGDSIQALGVCLFIFIVFFIILACVVVGIIGVLSPKNTILYSKASNVKTIIKRNTNKDENTYIKEEWEYTIKNFDFNTIKECFQKINCWGNTNCTFLCNHAIKSKTSVSPGPILLFNQFDNNICIIPLVKKIDGNIKAYLDVSTVISVDNVSKISIKYSSLNRVYRQCIGMHISLKKQEWNLFENWHSSYYLFTIDDELSTIFPYQEENFKRFTEMWNNR